MGGMNPEEGANPFESPTAESQEAPSGPLPLASRNARAVGVSIDGLTYVVAILPMLGILALEGEDMMFLFGGLSGLAVLALVVYQTYLIATTGQSIGKRVVGTRIVRANGMPAGFVHGVLIRSWAMGIITSIPMIGGFIGLFDVLLIFSEDRRCLHDRLADTIVIDTQASGASASGSGDYLPTNPWAR